VVWARICIDVNDRQDVVGFSAEVHNADDLVGVLVFPCGPFDSPVSCLTTAINELVSRYGEQLELTLF